MCAEKIVKQWLEERIKKLEQEADKAFEAEDYGYSDWLELRADSLRRDLQEQVEVSHE